MNLIGEVLELLEEQFLLKDISDVSVNSNGSKYIIVNHYLGGDVTITFYKADVDVFYEGPSATFIFPPAKSITKVAWYLGTIEGSLQQLSIQ
jgi:hypothetical protein